jgi:type II secretory pathway component PulF
MLLVYDLRVRYISGNIEKTTRMFQSQEEIEEFLKDNNYILMNKKINWFQTFKLYLLKIIMPSKAKIELNNKELITLLKILRNIARYRQSETKVQAMFENFAKNDKRYKSLSTVLEKLSTAMEMGIQLNKALEQVGVPKYITKAIEVGTESGSQEEVYESLIDLIETKIQTERKINSMLLMPKIIFFFIYAYFLLILFVIVPKTKQIIGMLDPSKFPELSKKLYALSDYALNHKIWFVFMSLIIMVVVYKTLYYLFKKTTRFIPKVKDVFLAEDYTMLSALLAVSLAARIQLHEAISFGAEVVKDNKLKTKMFIISEAILDKGQQLSQALRDLRFDRGNNFERDFYNVVYMMEDTAEIESGFKELYKEMKEKLEDIIDGTTKLINPVMLIVIAAIIITLYYGVQAPLLTMGK